MGVSAELVEEGSHTLVSPVVGRTAYRIVQETLTNVRKHAPGARARIHVRYQPDGVRLTISNTRPTRPPDPALAAAGGGTGLDGLRQRVDVIGGTLHATSPAIAEGRPTPSFGERACVALVSTLWIGWAGLCVAGRACVP